MPKSKPKKKLTDAHVRLFIEDIVALKKLAELNGSSWQIELRQLVRRYLKDHRELESLEPR